MLARRAEGAQRTAEKSSSPQVWALARRKRALSVTACVFRRWDSQGAPLLMGSKV